MNRFTRVLAGALAAVLADALARAGVPQDDIVMIDQSENWAYPEAIRV